MTALEDDFGWTLGVVFRAFIKATNAAVGDLPGGHRGYQILTASVRDQPESQSALCQQLGIDRTVMTYLLDDLERASLVERRPAPTDRRTRLVVSTDEGRKRLEELELRLSHAEAHVLSGLPEADRVTFKALLHRLAGHVNEQDPVPSACAVVQDIAVGAS